MAMERKRIGRLKAHGNTTPAALWLRQRFDRLDPCLSVRRPDWGSVLADLAKVGIAHGGGEPPAPLTEATLRKMWRRVRMDLCAETKEAAAGVAAPTVGRARTWAPEPVRDRSMPSPSGSAPISAHRKPAAPDYLTALRADIGKRSGRR